jgi:hypothetical protein
MNKIDVITNLTEQWYKLIGKEHHKDKDCHFYIQTEWSYGNPPKYWVLHYGYIIHDFEGEQYNSYEEAQDGLIVFLQKIIKEEIENQTWNLIDSPI